MKKTLFLQILVIWLFLGVLALEKIPQAELKLVSSFPSQEIFFRSFPIIDVDNDGCIYAVDNREHFVFKFNKDGDLLFKFGGLGQRPGELQWPSKISVDQKTGEIMIKDNNGIEVFDAKGNFVRRIRTFTGINNFYAGSSKILALVTIPGEKSLVNVYDYHGNLVQSIGQKYNLEYSLSKEISPYLLDQIVNAGSVLSDGELIYYVSYLFGEIKTFDFSDRVILEKKLTGVNGLEKYRERYREMIFKYGLKKNKDGTVTNWRIINDACLDGDYLYLLMLGYVTGGRYEILAVDKKSLEIKKRFVLPKGFVPEFIRSVRLNNKLNFVVSFQEESTGYYLIGILKEEGKR